MGHTKSQTCYPFRSSICLERMTYTKSQACYPHLSGVCLEQFTQCLTAVLTPFWNHWDNLRVADATTSNKPWNQAWISAILKPGANSYWTCLENLAVQCRTHWFAAEKSIYPINDTDDFGPRIPEAARGMPEAGINPLEHAEQQETFQ